jgi:hypothetical protein
MRYASWSYGATCKAASTHGIRLLCGFGRYVLRREDYAACLCEESSK